MTNREEESRGPQDHNAKVRICPRCGHRMIEQQPPSITCVECGYVLTPFSPEISPKLRALEPPSPKSFLWESNLLDRPLWGRRIDTFDTDFVMPKGTRKQVVLFILLILIALALIWYRVS